jgi:hypothetical protein
VLCDYDREYDSARRKILWAVVWKALHTYRNADGNLYVRYLYWNDGRWVSNYNWLDNDWNANNLSAVLATLFTSHPAPCGVEFWQAVP